MASWIVFSDSKAKGMFFSGKIAYLSWNGEKNNFDVIFSLYAVRHKTEMAKNERKYLRSIHIFPWSLPFSADLFASESMDGIQCLWIKRFTVNSGTKIQIYLPFKW